MKKIRKSAREFLLKGVVAMALGAITPMTMATPEGGQFITNPGWGTIVTVGPAGQTITSVFLPGLAVDPSNRHIIDWTSLDLGANETLKYLGANGYVVMNRIPGMGSPTQIDGFIDASMGSVYVVNAAGVMFGANAVISAADFHAAAATWSNGDQLQMDFLAGNSLTFNTSGEVHNSGTISATDTASLIGTRVEQHGAMSGRVLVLAAGNQITLDDLGSRVSITIDGSTMGAGFEPGGGGGAASLSGDAALVNTGTLTASHGGQVSLAAGDILGLAIQHSGQVFAPAGDVAMQAIGGAVWTSVAAPGDGFIDVSDATQAGSIDLAGEAVVHDGMAIARGSEGRIALRSETNTIVGGGSVLVADAGVIDADAGEILVSSANGTVGIDDAAFITATGGALGGDAGTVTFEGDSLLVFAPVKLTANQGEIGSLNIYSNKTTRVDATGAGIGPIDTDDLSNALVTPGSIGRIGAAAGQTLASVEGTLLVDSADELWIESDLLDLQGASTFRADQIVLSVDGGGTLSAPELTMDGVLSVEGDIELVGEGLLEILHGAVGDGVSELAMSSDGLVHIVGDLGDSDDLLGHLTVTSGLDMHFGGDIDGVQSLHVAGAVHLAGSLGGVAEPTTMRAADDVVIDAGSDVTIGAFGTQLSLTDGQNINIHADGVLTNYSMFSTSGSLQWTGGSVVNEGSLNASNVNVSSLSGSLHNTANLTGTVDVILNAAGDLSNTASLSGSTIMLGSTSGTVLSGGLLSGDAIQLHGASGVVVDADISGTNSVNLQSTTGDITTSALISGGDVVLQADAGSITNGATLSGDTVTMDAHSGIDLAAAIQASTDIDLSTHHGNITVDNQLDAGSSIRVSSETGSVDVQMAMQSDNIDLRAGEDVLVGESLVAGSALHVQAGNAVRFHEDASAGQIEIFAQELELSDVRLESIQNHLFVHADAIQLSGDAVLEGVNVSVSAQDGGLAGISLDGQTLTIEGGSTIDLGALVDGAGHLDVQSGNKLLIRGDLGSNEELSSISLSASNLQIGADVSKIQASGLIGLSSSNRDAYSEGLPAMSVWGENLSVISTGGDLLIGNNQGVSSLGNLMFSAAGTITIGDVTAMGDVTLQADQVNVWRRTAQMLRNGTGPVYSTQTSVVAGGELRIEGDLGYLGTGGDPSFYGFEGATGVDSVTSDMIRGFSASDLQVRAIDGVRLGLQSLPASGQDASDGEVVAAESQQVAVDIDFVGITQIRATAAALTEDFGIELVDGQDRPAGAGRMARAGHVIDDLAGGGDLIRVSRARLSEPLAKIAIESYNRAMDNEIEGVDAVTVLRETSQAWRLAAEEGTAGGTWSQWLRAGDEPNLVHARRIIAELDTAFDMLRRAGLTREEVEASRHWVAQRLGSNGVPVQIARTAVPERAG